MRRPISGPAPLALPAGPRWPGALRLALGLALIYGLSILGCGDSEQHQTLVAANERIHDQNKENTRLEQQTKDLQAQLARREADLARQHEEGLTSLKVELEDRQARRHQLAEEKAAQLENVIASLRLELGAVRREKIVLQGLVDRRPRVADVRKARAGIIEAVLGLCGVIVDPGNWTTRQVILDEVQTEGNA